MNCESYRWITIECFEAIQFYSKVNIILVTLLEISKFVDGVNIGDWAEELGCIQSIFIVYVMPCKFTQYKKRF